MRKRKRKSGNDTERIRKELYPKFLNGEDVSEELEEIFERNPEWRHSPPVGAGRGAWIDWKELTGHSIVKQMNGWVYGECDCGFEP